MTAEQTPAHSSSPSLPFEDIVEHAHEAFISITADGRVAAWNREAERTFGWPKEQALGTLLRDLIIPPRYRELHDAGLARFVETGNGPLIGKRLEIAAVHRNGNELPVELTISAYRAGPQTEWTFHAFVHDISDRYRANELQRHLATVVEHSVDAIATRTRDGLITTWNPAAERMFGWSAREMIGRRPDLLEAPGHEGEAEILLRRALAGEPVTAFDTKRVRKDGTVFDVSITLSPIRDDAGAVAEVAMIVRDETSRKRIERELAEAVELKAQFVAVASHELRTPLTSIAGFTTTLLERWDVLPDAQRLAFLQIIRDQTDRLTRLANDVLLLARLDAGAPRAAREPVHVGEAASAVLAQLGRESDASVVVSGDAVAAVAPDDLQRMLLNYIVNAFTHGAPPVTIEVVTEPDVVLVAVVDSGSGVTADAAESLFAPYGRGRDTGVAGVGLGLAIVRALAEASGGSAWVEPAPRGRFLLRLPRP